MAACQAEKTFVPPGGVGGGFDVFSGKVVQQRKLERFKSGGTWSRSNSGSGLSDTNSRSIGRSKSRDSDTSKKLGSEEFHGDKLTDHHRQQQQRQQKKQQKQEEGGVKKNGGRISGRDPDTPARASRFSSASTTTPRFSAVATTIKHEQQEEETTPPPASTNIHVQTVVESSPRTLIRNAAAPSAAAPNLSFLPPQATAAGGKPISARGETDSQAPPTPRLEAIAETPRLIRHARSTSSFLTPYNSSVVGLAAGSVGSGSITTSSAPGTREGSRVLVHGVTHKRTSSEVPGSLRTSSAGSLITTGSNGMIHQDHMRLKPASSDAEHGGGGHLRSESGRFSSSSDSAGGRNPNKDPSVGSPESSAGDGSPIASEEKKLVTTTTTTTTGLNAGVQGLRKVESWPAASPATPGGGTPRLRSWSGNIGNLGGGGGLSNGAGGSAASLISGTTATPLKVVGASNGTAASSTTSGPTLPTGNISGLGSNGKVMYAGGGGHPVRATAAGNKETTVKVHTPRTSGVGLVFGVQSGGKDQTMKVETAARGASAAADSSVAGRGNIFAVGESLLIKRTLLSVDPEEIKKVGNDQYKKGNFAEALSLYDRAIQLSPGQASYHSNRAAALTGLGRLAEAVQECEKAIKLNSSSVRAHQRLATLCLRLGRLEGAKKHLQIAAQQHIDMGDMQRVVEKVEKHLQNCYNARSAADWSAVVREMDAAIVAGADSAPQLFALKAEAFLKLHKYEEADILLATAHKIESGLSKSTSIQADIRTLLVQAQVDMTLGRFEGAVTAAEKAVYFDPQNAEASHTLKRARAVAAARTTGNDLYKAGRVQEASVAYSEGLQYNPTNAILLCNRAACRSKLGHYEKAVEDCNAALDAQPYYTKALLRRAHSYSKMERWDQSLKDYEALRKEMPANRDVERALFEVQAAIKKLRGSATEPKKQFGFEVDVCSNDQLREAISNHGIAVVQFNTRWSEGCRQMASVVEQLYKLNPTVNFFKVDIEANPYLAKAENVDSVPTFKIYKNGFKVMELPNPTPHALENALSHLCKY
ncbi:unnamed protein product [Sphagnum jensenii]|uniref:Thioredoxin domain-containing protein n=1 Tax=Sphagnum jensenii TaxID=128206 RepID=A0ABP0W788_9BRYO